MIPVAGSYTARTDVRPRSRRRIGLGIATTIVGFAVALGTAPLSSATPRTVPDSPAPSANEVDQADEAVPTPHLPETGDTSSADPTEVASSSTGVPLEGSSAPSPAPSATVTPASPSDDPLFPPVGAPAAVPGVSSVVVSWERSPTPHVTQYVVTADPGPATCTATLWDPTQCVIGATAGVSYTYTVVTYNISGVSPPSAPSMPVTATAPPIPDEPPQTAAGALMSTAGPLAEVDGGQRLTLTGAGFAAHSSIRLVMYSTPTLLADGVTDSTGAFAIEVALPSDPGAGTHTVVALGVDPSGATRILSSQVRFANAPMLAATGGQPLAAVVLALVLLSGGGTLWWAARTRTAQPGRGDLGRVARSALWLTTGRSTTHR